MVEIEINVNVARSEQHANEIEYNIQCANKIAIFDQDRNEMTPHLHSSICSL